MEGKRVGEKKGENEREAEGKRRGDWGEERKGIWETKKWN